MAAGNNAIDACNIGPAFSEYVVTVGSFNQDLIPGTRVNITAPAEIETRFGL